MWSIFIYVSYVLVGVVLQCLHSSLNSDRSLFCCGWVRVRSVSPVNFKPMSEDVPIESKSFINSSSNWWWSQSHISASKDFTAVIKGKAKPQKNCSSWNVALEFQKRIAHMTWIERMEFHVILIWFHRPWHHRAASAPRHWGYISLSQPPAPDSAESMQNSTLCLRHFRKGIDLVCKREGMFRRQQASDCKPTHVANLCLGTWLFGFQKFGIWFIFILPSTMLPLYRSKALDPFLFQTWRKRQTNQPTNEAKAEVR